MIAKEINEAAALIKNGGVIAYPTEAVYGLGCDPFNQAAVLRLYEIKGRPATKGCILIASKLEQIEPLIDLSQIDLKPILATWPGPFTWVFPASESAPSWLTTQNHSLAIRLTAHPVAKALCEACNQVIVSTSANLSHQPPLRRAEEVESLFGKTIDLILPGSVDLNASPSEIRDAKTLEVLRKG